MPSLAAYIGGGLLAGTGKGIVANAKAKREKALVQDERAFLSGEREKDRALTRGEGLLSREQTQTLSEMSIANQQDLAVIAADLQKTLTDKGIANQQHLAGLQAGLTIFQGNATRAQAVELARMQRNLTYWSTLSMNERMTTLAEIEAALRKDLANIASTEAITLQGERLAAEGETVKSIERGAGNEMVAILNDGTVTQLVGVPATEGLSAAEETELKTAIMANTTTLGIDPDASPPRYEATSTVDKDAVLRAFAPTLDNGKDNPNHNAAIFNALGGNAGGPPPAPGGPNYGQAGPIFTAHDGTRVTWDASLSKYVEVK